MTSWGVPLHWSPAGENLKKQKQKKWFHREALKTNKTSGTRTDHSTHARIQIQSRPGQQQLNFQNTSNTNNAHMLEVFGPISALEQLALPWHAEPQRFPTDINYLYHLYFWGFHLLLLTRIGFNGYSNIRSMIHSKQQFHFASGYPLGFHLISTDLHLPCEG